jgi:hypothetical protein
MQQASDLRRSSYMPTRTKSAAKRGSNKGSFADSRSGLLPLFSGPDWRGELRWPEVFGHERRKTEEKARPFNVLEAPRSSSDSK